MKRLFWNLYIYLQARRDAKAGIMAYKPILLRYQQSGLLWVYNARSKQKIDLELKLKKAEHLVKEVVALNQNLSTQEQFMLRPGLEKAKGDLVLAQTAFAAYESETEGLAQAQSLSWQGLIDYYDCVYQRCSRRESRGGNYESI